MFYSGTANVSEQQPNQRQVPTGLFLGITFGNVPKKLSQTG